MRLIFLFVSFVLMSPALNAEQLNTIANFHAVDNGLLTAGQVKPEHVEQIKTEEIGLVINLATASEEHNGREAFLLAEQGISYLNIPVKWDQPTEADLALFFAVMDGRQERKTLVHCFANYRASAFTYLYRVIRQGVDEREARKDLEVVWTKDAFEQYPQWRTYIDKALSNHAVET